MRKRSPQIAARNRRIQEEAQTGPPYPSRLELAKRHNVTIATINKILAGIEPPPDATVIRRVAFSQLKELSKLHRQIGVRLETQRHFNLRQTKDEVASILRMTTHNVRKAELGIHDLTLSELQRLADYLQISLPDLVTVQDLTGKFLPQG